MNGIDKITAAILSEAQEEADRLTAEAEKASAGIEAENKIKAENIAALYADRAVKEGAELAERAKSASALIRRNALLKAKSEIMDMVYDKALDRLLHQPDDEYFNMLAGILGKTVRSQIETEHTEQLHDTYGEFCPAEAYTLLLDEDTAKRVGERLFAVASELLAGYGKKLVKAESYAHIGGGFILICGDVELSAALPVLMKQVRGSTEGELYRMLFA